MSVLIHDPYLAAEVREARAKSPGDRYTEVWEGVVVMPAMPNNEHQNIVLWLGAALGAFVDRRAGDSVQPGANVSDRDDGWKQNYRCPDVVVALAGGRAKNRNTHWYGGPDLVVEIESPGQDPRDKNDFYAAIGTREVLIVERDPWALELYQLDGNAYRLVGRADDISGVALPSSVLPLTFSLRTAEARPEIVVTHRTTGQAWTA